MRDKDESGEVPVLGYLDCFSGISGDMLLGALVDAGVELDALRDGLASLPLSGFSLEARPVSQQGVAGVAMRVILDGASQEPERRLPDVLDIIEAGTLPERARARATAIFRRLAEAEARVHATRVDDVHFHEVGAVDAIVDIVGVALGLELLGVDELWCSELPLTTGRVDTRHGELPIPAPATVELLRATDAVWRPLRAATELVTPTGAAIVATLARFGTPRMRMDRVGYGFGTRALPWANCLRVIVGRAPEADERMLIAQDADTVMVIESNIDDMTGEALGWLTEHLLAAGALDVSLSPLMMKKNRPGTRVSVIATPAMADALARELLRSSSTLGVRFAEWQRVKAGRRIERIATPLGEATIKLKVLGGSVTGVAAEYESARALAAVVHLPVHEVIARVEAAARTHYGLEPTDTSG